MPNIRKPLPIGGTFGAWTIREEVNTSAKGIHYRCTCSCGTEQIVRAASLKDGSSTRCRSCSNRVAGRTTHGENRRGSATPEYRAWRAMQDRVNGRGTTNPENYIHVDVSPEWVGDDGFKRFLESVGRRPSEQHSLDRIDSNGNYEPGNVRWATPREQVENRRITRTLTIGCETLTLAEWSRRSGVSYETLMYRLKAGWSSDELLTPTTPAVPKQTSDQ